MSSARQLLPLVQYSNSMMCADNGTVDGKKLTISRIQSFIYTFIYCIQETSYLNFTQRRKYKIINLNVRGSEKWNTASNTVLQCELHRRQQIHVVWR